MKNSFEIVHLDSLGQGVSKKTDKITFITKTLPGEEGICRVTKENSKVRFGKLVVVNKKSPDRITPDCVHYDQCPACHYQHASYDKEIELKHDALRKISRKIITDELVINTFKATKRFYYRNRVQLHYNLYDKTLGFMDINDNSKTIEVPNCILATPRVTQKIKDLYSKKSWLTILGPNAPKEGHIEIYDCGEPTLRINVNKPYASGGFRQVNKEMNDQLVELVSNNLSEVSTTEKLNIIDLFGGSGNLTRQFTNSKTMVIDSHTNKKELLDHQKFLKLDLYSKMALDYFQKAISVFEKTDVLILDPPRSGLKNLSDFVKKSKPKYIFYISCWPSTMIRDLESISSDYEVSKLSLFDFFPSTFHFETFAVLELKNE